MRKIWNRPAAAVWSLSTVSATGQPNMNICTYVTTISMEPKMMLVGVYEGTQTLRNCRVGETVLLQLLSEALAPVVRTCGQTSGKDIDKITRLQKRFTLSQANGHYYFDQAAGYMTLTITELIETEADHVLLLGRVTAGKNLDDVPILTTTYLKANGYVR